MTKQDFVNVFIRHRKIKSSIGMSLIGFAFAMLFFLGITQFVEVQRPSVFVFGSAWIIGEVFIALFYYFFFYNEEKSKFNEEVCRDIIE